MRRSLILPMLLAGFLPLGAQSNFSGPVAGYVFDDPGRSIRPVVGNPGAAYLGSAPASRWIYAAVSPNGKMALAVTRGAVDLIPDISAGNRFTALPGAIPTVERIVWSMDSTTAALYSPASNQLQRITGLGGAPQVHAPFDLSTLAGAVANWSMSPDGHAIALTSGGSGGAFVYVLVDDALSPVPIGGFASPAVSTFSADDKSLFVLDRGIQKIVRVQLPGGVSEGLIDVSSITGVQDMRASADGTLLYVAGQLSLSAFDLSTWQPVWSQALETTPAFLTPFSVSPQVFLLDYPRTHASPLWLFDGRAAQLYFVPAGNVNGDRSR